MGRLKTAARALAPHGLVEERARRRHGREVARRERDLVRARAERIARLNAAASGGGRPAFDYELAIDLLVRSGLDEDQVRAGSMPESTLRWATEAIGADLPAGRPPLALHVGNFVGVSLAAVTAALVAADPDALVISVDPGMAHRGVADPQRHVLTLLSHFGLQTASLVIAGYSGARSPRDDALSFQDGRGVHDPVLPRLGTALAQMAADAACEQVVPNLARLLPGRFDAVLLDGNHDGDYLRRELGRAADLLGPGGLVVVDDVLLGGVWQGIGDAFRAAADGGRLETAGDDGRAAMLRRVSPG